MSGKTGKRATGTKPTSVRRHDSQADGAFGRENERPKTESELNEKISGQPSKKHSDYTEKKSPKRS